MIDEKHIISIRGKRFILYEGILNEAHQKGLKSIETEIIQFPTQENNMCCIARATVTGEDNRIFMDYGDASIDSVDGKIVPHLIRMACTRAKARALRDFCNIGICGLDEVVFSDLEDDAPSPPTTAQLSLLKRLSLQHKININYDSLDKQSASKLISELQQKKVG